MNDRHEELIELETILIALNDKQHRIQEILNRAKLRLQALKDKDDLDNLTIDT